MERIKKTKGSNATILFTGILIGMMYGVVMLSILVSYRIDEYQEKILYLESVIEDKDTRLQKLEESINKTKVIVKEIVIHLNFGDDENKDAVTLEKHIKEKYSSLIGKEVKSIDIEILGEVIDKRIMLVDDNRYRLSVSRVFLTELLILWVDIKKIDE